MTSRVSLNIEQGIASLVMDDGQNNVLSPAMLQEINNALDAAEQAGVPVVISGREEIFSAGFDLKILRTGVGNALQMLLGGFRLAHRMLSFPTPVIIACNGHAVAMGSFLLLAADYRVGVNGNFKIMANEVRIGLTLPHAAICLCRARLSANYFTRAALLSEVFDPETAVKAGFLDAVVAREELLQHAHERALDAASLDALAHRASKHRVRRHLLKNLASAIRRDRWSFIMLGIKRLLQRSK